VTPFAVDVNPGAARCAVFLHGFLGCARDWLDVAALLPGDVRGVAVDLPGHGASPEPLGAADRDGGARFSGDALFRAADDLAARLSLAGITELTLAGYSMGGRLALAFLLRHPGRVRGAVLIGASPGLRGEREREERGAWDQALAERLETIDFRSFLEAWYDQPLFAGMKKLPAHPSLIERRLAGSPRAIAGVTRPLGLGAQPSLWEEIRRTQVPIVYVAGELDDRYVAIGREVVAHAHRARLVVVPGASHAVHAFAPGEVASIVTDLARS
jgi:2-succinyl-6-hydroxy-2,4-cyclohexadiene-1-carboxylate synthase